MVELVLTVTCMTNERKVQFSNNFLTYFDLEHHIAIISAVWHELC